MLSMEIYFIVLIIMPYLVFRAIKVLHPQIPIQHKTDRVTSVIIVPAINFPAEFLLPPFLLPPFLLPAFFLAPFLLPPRLLLLEVRVVSMSSSSVSLSSDAFTLHIVTGLFLLPVIVTKEYTKLNVICNPTLEIIMFHYDLLCFTS